MRSSRGSAAGTPCPAVFQPSIRRRAGAWLITLSMTLPAVGQSTTRVSVSSGDVQSNTGSSSASYITPNGRFIVFQSSAPGLVAGDTNGATDVFVRDRVLGTTSRVSLPDPGMAGQTQANRACFLGRAGTRFCSDNGRHVVFVSASNNLVPNDTNGDPPFHIDGTDIFVRDRDLDNNGVFDEPGVGKTKTVRVSVTSGESQYTEFVVGIDTYGGGVSNPSISASGRFVAFESQADNLSNESGTIGSNIYWRDRDNDGNGIFDEPGDVCVIPIPQGCVMYDGAVTKLVSKVRTNSGGAFDGFCERPAISGNGRHVAFQTASSRIDYDTVFDSDSNGRTDIYIRDMLTNGAKAQRISLDSDENQNTDAGSVDASVDHSGRYVAFVSSSSQLLGFNEDTNGVADVYLRDRGNPGGGEFILSFGSTSRVSYGLFFNFLQGTLNRFVQLTEASSQPAISADARHVAFVTDTNCVVSGLICGDQNGLKDVFVRDTLAGNEVTTAVSLPASGGLSANGASEFPSVSDNGVFVSFQSAATDMVTPDANGANNDVYLRTTIQLLKLLSAVSRRTHGAAGDFDIPLSLADSTVEPRAGGTQKVLMTFNVNVAAADGTPSCNDVTLIGGTCTGVSISGAVVTINLTSQVNSCVSVRASGIVDGGGNPIDGYDSVLINNHPGDVNANGPVNILDLQAIKNQLNQPVGSSNFRLDVNCNGTINILDLQATKNNLNQPLICL